MDPSSHRPSTAKLAQLTSGRVLSVRYRLAPQSTFPAALLDALISYLSLLSPPPNSPHGPISASHIVLAGDSAGGNLAMSLLQLLLQLHRSSPTDPSSPPTIRFHGKDVPIPLPAGVATTSAWLDMTRSMPSLVTNYHYDYLTPASVGDAAAHFPPCAVWPTDPPRGDLYSDDSMLCHPLVSPLAAKDWSGSCPLWMGYGQEMLVDEGKIAARRASRQGVPVVWEEWEAMPHTFALIFGGSEFGKEYFRHWAAFAKRVVGEGRKGGTEAVVTSGKWVEAKTLKEKEVDVGGLLPELTDEEVDRLMGEGMVKRSKGIEGEAKVLPKL
ncbi:hypothetical protein MMC20_007913 [Loxospora ochrophaea]|nr:hypothetical protein [Loxospora ochrophaea]